jgi:hypothetical protein
VEMTQWPLTPRPRALRLGAHWESRPDVTWKASPPVMGEMAPQSRNQAHDIEARLCFFPDFREHRQDDRSRMTALHHLTQTQAELSSSASKRPCGAWGEVCPSTGTGSIGNRLDGIPASGRFFRSDLEARGFERHSVGGPGGGAE